MHATKLSFFTYIFINFLLQQWFIRIPEFHINSGLEFRYDWDELFAFFPLQIIFFSMNLYAHFCNIFNFVEIEVWGNVTVNFFVITIWKVKDVSKYKKISLLNSNRINSVDCIWWCDDDDGQFVMVTMYGALGLIGHCIAKLPYHNTNPPIIFASR